MDTKLKKWKSIVSFAAFFIGISLLLYDGVSLLGRNGLAFGRLWEDIKEVSEEDYQNTAGFRREMSNYLGNFISMAVGGPVWDYYGAATQLMEYPEESVVGQEEVVQEGVHFDWEEYGYYNNPQENKKAADQYHEYMKNNKNLLYQVYYENRLLYDNTDGLSLDGPSRKLPEGYNFLMYFDGKTVTVVKDGKELDIYQDGIYKEDSDWYIPGYRNFNVDDNTEKVAVCLAAAARPVLYVNNNYQIGNSRGQDGDSLYWIDRRQIQLRNAFAAWMVMAVISLVCLAVWLFLRKDKKRADRFLAKGVGKLWYEGKLLLVAGLIILFFSQFRYQLQEISMMWEMEQQIYPYMLRDYMMMVGSRPAGLLVLFWAFYFLVVDLRFNKKTWRNSVTGKVVSIFRSAGLRQPFQKRMIRSFLPVFFSGLLLTLLAAVAVAVSTKGASTPYLILCILAMALLLAAWVLYVKRNKALADDMGRLVDQIAAVRSGKLNEDLRLSKDSSLFQAAEDLNDIRKGMDEAVKEKVKSEGMKVELVSNVSHDLKTPLTSIISYVDLLKQEEDLPDHIRDYIGILDNKSQRLKAMVQDVFEVSKAASGQLPVSPEILDLVKLLKQTLADMAERIENSSVTVKTEIPEDGVMIEADGQRLYRVFQNLIQNALQYSLEGSRVYITLQRRGTVVAASVTNTSRQEISGRKDYTERFTRGDESRSDGGSGLGLSIARSFTEACGGAFRVETIADLFIVTVEFKEIE